MMRVLTWLQGDTGTIQAADGHVHLRKVTNPDRIEAAVRKIVDDAPALPATTTYFAAAFGRAGASFGIVGTFFTFGDLPEDWEERYALAPFAPPASTAPDPTTEPDAYADFTGEELTQMATAASLAIADGATRADIIAALEAANGKDDLDVPDSTSLVPASDASQAPA